MTLVDLPGFATFYETLSEDESQVLLNTVGTTLRANSLDGDSAGQLADGKYGLIHEKGLDVKALEAKIAEATRAFDPTGKGIDVQAGTLDLDLAAINEEDLTKGLVYTINHFKEQAGAKFNVKEIAKNMNNLVKEAVNSLNGFRKMVGAPIFRWPSTPSSMCVPARSITTKRWCASTATSTSRLTSGLPSPRKPG